MTGAGGFLRPSWAMVTQDLMTSCHVSIGRSDERTKESKETEVPLTRALRALHSLGRMPLKDRTLAEAHHGCETMLRKLEKHFVK